MDKMRSITDSPFLKEEFKNPLTGAHLSWMSSVSDNQQGGTGNGIVRDGNGNVVGKYKSVGGLCWVGVAVPASSTITITMPSKPAYRGPLLFSDGQSLWGSVDGDGKWTITVTATAALDGYGLYWS